MGVHLCFVCLMIWQQRAFQCRQIWVFFTDFPSKAKWSSGPVRLAKKIFFDNRRKKGHPLVYMFDILLACSCCALDFQWDGRRALLAVALSCWQGPTWEESPRWSSRHADRTDCPPGSTGQLLSLCVLLNPFPQGVDYLPKQKQEENCMSTELTKACPAWRCKSISLPPPTPPSQLQPWCNSEWFIGLKTPTN